MLSLSITSSIVIVFAIANGILYFPGNFLNILKLSDDVLYPDIQFWNRASDPVLARDPFSSLMWVLYCLPYPFVTCQESIIALVHAFYAVAITQVYNLTFLYIDNIL